MSPDSTRLERRKVTARRTRRTFIATLAVIGIGLYFGLGDPTLLNGVIAGVPGGGVVLGLAYGAERVYRNRAK